MSSIREETLKPVAEDYAIREVRNVVPYRSGVEVAGRTALRLWFREQGALIVATMSDSQARALYAALDEALAEGEL